MKLKIIFIGTGEFGVPVLSALSKDSHFEIPFIVTAKDKAQGRGLKVAANEIKKTAELNKLFIHQVESLNELKQKIIQANPDFLLVVSFGEIIKKDILTIPGIAAVNIHGSILPRYRGASPIQEAILQGEKSTGVTWTIMNQKLDAGDIIDQKSIEISQSDDYPTLSKKLSLLAAAFTAKVLQDFAQTRKSKPQDEALATYCRKIKKEDGAISFETETAEQILRKIRAYTPWPGVFFIFHGKRIKIIQARVGEQKISSGEMEILDGKILALRTAKSTLLPIIVQPESKRAMTIEEFLRGVRG